MEGWREDTEDMEEDLGDLDIKDFKQVKEHSFCPFKIKCLSVQFIEESKTHLFICLRKFILSSFRMGKRVAQR